MFQTIEVILHTILNLVIQVILNLVMQIILDLDRHVVLDLLQLIQLHWIDRNLAYPTTVVPLHIVVHLLVLKVRVLTLKLLELIKIAHNLLLTIGIDIIHW